MFSKAYQKALHLSIVCPKFESHMLLGMCLTVMIPSARTRLSVLWSPGSISEPSVPWYLKRICKDFGTGDNFLSVSILTSNACCILTWDKICQAGYEYHYTTSCRAIVSWTNTGTFPWVFCYFTNKNKHLASISACFSCLIKKLPPSIFWGFFLFSNQKNQLTVLNLVYHHLSASLFYLL